MLSYSSVLVLGIIAEKPINPYEMKKMLARISIRKWLPIAASSLYATIRALNEDGFVSCEPERTGNMPEKKVYTITSQGKSALDETLRTYLGSVELNKRKTHIASLMVCHLPKDDAFEILQRKIRKLENMELMMGRIITSTQGNEAIAYNGRFPIQHELALIKAELASVRDLSESIHADHTWAHFLSSMA